MSIKMKKLLKKLISFESVSLEIPVNEKALLFCQSFLKEKGIKSKIFWHGKHPSLEWGAICSEVRFMFNTHIDVVPALKESFATKEDGNKIWGRGSADTKAMVAMFLSLDAEIVKKAAKKGTRFVIVSDEEIGGNTTKLLLPKMPNLEFALFGEPTQLQLNNEAKGIMQVKISAKGKSTHGSNPWLGQNAILKLIADLNQFLSANPPPNNYTWETTFNFSQISGGVAINQVPSECTLFCDVRYRPGVSTSQIIDKFNQHFSGSIVEIAKSESAIFTHQKNEFLQKLAIAVKNAGIKPLFSKALGSSDARHCTAMNIPTVVFGPIGDGLHEDHEWVDVESLLKVRKIINHFIKEL